MGDLSMVGAARRLARHPQFTVPTILLAGVTAGAAVAMIALLRGVLLTPLAFDEPERLVSLCERHERLGDWCAAATPTVAELARRSRTLEAAGAGRSWTFTLEVDGVRETVGGGIAGPGFFDALGVRPALGRLPTAAETGESDGRVLLLSHDLWTSRFAADPDVLGRVVRLGPDPHTVIGVLPAGVEVPDIPGARLWRPLHFGAEDVDRREWRGFVGVGRVRTGVDLAEAESELAAIYRRLDDELVEIDETWSFDLIPLLDRVVGGVRGQLRVFAAAVGLFLLIGAADVLLLFSLRGLRLADDDRIRRALGARAGHRLKRSAMEGMAVGLGALVVTMASGTLFLRLLSSLAPPEIPRLDLVRLDAASLVTGAALALATTLASALVAAHLTRPRGSHLVAAGRSSAGPWTRRVRSGLVSLESALSLVLVAAALILARSFEAYGDWDPGFPVEGLASAQLFASTAEVTDADAAADAWRRVEEHARAVPGVRSASTVSAGPLFGGSETDTYTTDAGEPSGPLPVVRWYDASPGYFATLGRAVLVGRSLDERDARGAERVAVLNETMVRRAFPDVDPIGRMVRLPETDLALRVVGVVADVPPLVPGEPVEPEIFWSNRQLPRWGAFLVLRLEPGASIPDIEAALAPLEPTISVGGLRPLAERLDAALVRPRFLVFLIGVFALLAALLAAGGLFAVLSVTVSERMKEMGIRVALGAPRGRVLWRTLRGGISMAGAGALVGTLLYLSAETALVRSVPGLAPAGVLLLGASIALLLSSAVAAALPAAIRAAHADPVDLLRDPG